MHSTYNETMAVWEHMQACRVPASQTCHTLCSSRKKHAKRHNSQNMQHTKHATRLQECGHLPMIYLECFSLIEGPICIMVVLHTHLMHLPE